MKFNRVLKISLVVLVAITSRYELHAGDNCWTTSGPYGGTIFELAINPVHRNILYAAAFPNGVYKSVDSGSTWVKTIDHVMKMGGYKLALDPTQPDVVYLSGYNGLFKSIDGGRNWRHIGRWGKGSITRIIRVNPFNPRELIANPMMGIFKSTDGGESWSSLGFEYISVGGLAYDPHQPNLVYALSAFPDRMSNPHGFLRSFDGGATWESTFRDRPNLHIAEVIACDPNTAGVVYLGAWNKAFGPEIYQCDQPYECIFKSTDFGETWACINHGLEVNMITAICVEPSDSRILYIGAESGFYKSTDGGESWRKAGKGIHEPYIFTIVADEVNGILYLGTYKGAAYKSLDKGESFQKISCGITEIPLKSLGINPLNPRTMYAASSNALFKTLNGGHSWAYVGDEILFLHGPSMGIQIDPADTSTVYLGTYSINGGSGAGFAVTHDGGETWELKKNDLPDDIYISDVAQYADSTEHVLAIAANHGIYLSRDKGETWQKTALVHDRSIWAVWIHPERPNLMFAYGAADVLYKSDDGGATWNRTGCAPDRTSFYRFYCDQHHPKYIYSSSSDGILRSTNLGETWTIFKPHGQTIQIHPENPQWIMVGKTTMNEGPGGIELSENGGISWRSVNEGLHWNLPDVSELHVHPHHPNQVYALAFGFYSYTCTTTGVTRQLETSIPLQFHLSQNYPNPFQSGTSIPFHLD